MTKPTSGYARVEIKAKGWPRVRFPNGKNVVEWQCKHCDEWVTGPEHEHPCGDVQA